MSGIDGQAGWKTETTWNTLVTVDKFAPILSADIKNDQGERLVSQGIRAGRRIPFAHKRGVPIIGGPVRMELGNVDIATLLHHMFGTVATTGAGPYTHTYTPGSLRGKSLTMQIGEPDIGDTVRAFTYGGVKFPSWELTANSGELAQLNLDVSAASETTATALAVAAYSAAWEPFAYTEGSLTMQGAAVTIDSIRLRGSNTLRTDRKPVGGSAITEQLANGRRELSLELTMDFEDLAEYTLFANDTLVTAVLTLDNGTDTLTITAKGYLTGETPGLTGPEILKQPLTLELESATSDADAITAVLVNTEASAA